LRSKEDYAAARGCRGINSVVDGGGVERFSVAGCAVVADIEEAVRLEWLFLGCGLGDGGDGGRGDAEGAGTQKVAAKGIECVHERILRIWVIGRKGAACKGYWFLHK
jgi:hypothetical protein